MLHNAKNLLQGWIELFFSCKNFIFFFFFVTKEIKNVHNVTHDCVFAFGEGLGSKAHSYIAAGKSRNDEIRLFFVKTYDYAQAKKYREKNAE